MHELVEMMKTGGPVMVVTKLIILAGSVAAVIIGIERALFLRGFSAKARELHEQIIRALLRGDAAIALHESDRSHIATVALYRAAFDRANRQARISREAFDLTLRADELTEVVMDHASEISAAIQAPRSAPAPHPEARAAVAQGHA